MHLSYFLAAALAFPLATGGQEKPPEVTAKAPLLYTGKPMRVEFSCTEEDLRRVGLACTEDDPCPVYLELSAIEPVGARTIIAGNLHTASSTLDSILLVGEDGGKAWHEPFERIRSAVLDGIQFLDLQTGWASGYILHSLPHDPFLLLTTDGGTTWRLRPVSEDSRAGAIERFRFETRANGALWLDRSQSGETDSLYERYESMTGGESWMLREVSGRPLLKDSQRPAPDASDWRLRPEAATKSYHVERRQGDRWQTVASFLILTGECKPPAQD